jgi:hypothetical protein
VILSHIFPLPNTSLREQKAMLMEDSHDLELRDLREKVSSLTLDNKNLSSRTDSQKEQSELSVHVIGQVVRTTRDCLSIL